MQYIPSSMLLPDLSVAMALISMSLSLINGEEIGHLIHNDIEQCINTLSARQHGRHFPDDILKCIFLNENVWISIKISLKFVLKGLINNIPALVQIMAWCRTGDKPLYEPMLVSLLTHICVTWPQWVTKSLGDISLSTYKNPLPYIQQHNSMG